MKTLLGKLKLLRAVWRMYRDPRDVNSLFEISQYGLPSQALEVSIRKAKASPEVNELVEKRYLGPAIDLEILARYPEGTLAHEYAKHMRVSGLKPDFYPPLEAAD